MTVFAEDLLEPEAPVLLDDGGWLCTEMDPSRGAVVRLDAAGGGKRVLARTGRPNGLAVDRRGAVWVAESRDPAVLRMTLEGEVQERLTEVDGEPMRFPNDVAIARDGAIWITDTGVRHGDWIAADRGRHALADVDGRVYRIDPATMRIERYDGGLLFANGLAWGPDGRLYVNETVTGAIHRYDVGEGGRLGPRQAWASVLAGDPVPGRGGPDGMKWAQDGTLFCAVFGYGEVTVHGPDGAVRARLRTQGAKPTNLAWGPPGARRIHVTEVERNRMEVLDVGVDGRPLYR